jgi:membrane protease YdiL (CAAX protease family)
MPSPPSPIDWPRDSFRIAFTFIAIVGAVILVFVTGAIGIVATVLITHAPLAGSDLKSCPPRMPVDITLWSQVSLYAPIAAYLLLILRPISKLSFAQLGLRMPTMRELWIGVVGAVAMWLAVEVSGGVIDALTHHHDTEAAIDLLKQLRTPLQQAEFILIAIVLAPLVEELAFRVFLFSAFWRYMPFWGAAIASSVLFGLVHAQCTAWQLLTVSVPLVCGAIVLSYVYARTRCYWSAVLSHALFNSVSVVLVFVFHVKA